MSNLSRVVNLGKVQQTIYNFGDNDIHFNSPITYVESNGNITFDISVATTLANGLMSSTDKSKLDNIASEANKYVHPSSAAGAKSSGLYKITTDANGHVTAATEVIKSDITALGIPGSDTNTTYSISQDANDGHKFTFSGSDGSSTTITIPDNVGGSGGSGEGGGGGTTNSTNTTDKIYLIGATSQSSTPTTYSNVSCYASGGYLYSGGTKVSVEGHTHTGETSTHTHAASVITSGILPVDRGGTGNSTGYVTAGKSSGITVGSRATCEGYNARGTGDYSHCEGRACEASDSSTHAEGYSTIASAAYSHAEGHTTTASGSQSHAEGKNTTASGSSSHAEGQGTTTEQPYSHVEGYSNTIEYNNGRDSSHAEGNNNTVKGTSAHAEGKNNKAIGDYSHAEGYNNTAKGVSAHVEGKECSTDNDQSHAEGNNCAASGYYSHAEGYHTTASANGSHTAGYYTVSTNQYQTVVGKCNVESSSTTNSYFIVGGGTDPANRANAFRVSPTQSWAAGTMNASGADYAEMFEWEDGNPNNEDRRGLFVTLSGEKIRAANPDDDFILGITSANPTVLGDVEDDQWKGMYEYDVFGAPIYENVEIPDLKETRSVPKVITKTIQEKEIQIDEETGEEKEVLVDREIEEVIEVEEEFVVEPAHIEHRQKMNPNYDSSKEYIPRSERPEWSPVGMIGKLITIDDGSCEEDKWAKVGPNGVATASDTRTKFRVMERLDDTHIQILILP